LRFIHILKCVSDEILTDEGGDFHLDLRVITISRSRERNVAGSIVIPVIYHEIATHPMGARDDREIVPLSANTEYRLQASHP
jgi:hypothetical protein